MAISGQDFLTSVTQSPFAGTMGAGVSGLFNALSQMRNGSPGGNGALTGGQPNAPLGAPQGGANTDAAGGQLFSPSSPLGAAAGPPGLTTAASPPQSGQLLGLNTITGAPNAANPANPPPGQFDDSHWNSLIGMLMQKLGVSVGGGSAAAGGGILGSGGASGNLAPSFSFSGIYSR